MRNRLLDLIEKFKNVPILVVGDLILDCYVWGNVSRISPEAPVVVVDMTEESKRLGGAANVTSNLLSLGAKVKVAGVVGDDEQGRTLCSLLESKGADISLVIKDRTRPTTTKTRVIATAQQIVRVDREVRSYIGEDVSLELNSKIKDTFSSVSGVIVSDYAKGVLSSSLASTIGEFYKSYKKKIPVIIDPKKKNFNIYSSSTVIKPNKKEAEEASGCKITDHKSAIFATKELFNKWDADIIMTTLGENGMVLVGREKDICDEVYIPTMAKEVYDVSGAGDTVSAVFGLCLSVGESPKMAATLANYAAGLVVAEVGTVPINLSKLIELIKSKN